MPKIHTLYREQTVATDLDTAWDFISRPENLNEITPDDMHFQIVSDVPERMRDGLIIEYRIGIPLLGKQVWLSELKHIRERHSFVDEQRVARVRHARDVVLRGGRVPMGRPLSVRASRG